MTPKRIAVVLHEHDGMFDRTFYLVHVLIPVWQRQGHRVQIVRGLDRSVGADIVIPHVDLSVRPSAYQAFLASFPVVVNRGVIDISKRAISSAVLERGDAYEGPVIVKTDLNFGGLPEADFDRAGHPIRTLRRHVLAKWASRLAPRRSRLTPWRWIETLDIGAYAVFPSLASVPRVVFDNPHLMVEAFHAERHGDEYCVRSVYVCADRAVQVVQWSRNPVVKVSVSHRVADLPVPPEIHEVRRRIGFDFGKLDFVLRDGRVFLFDVNPTPGAGLLRRYGFVDRVAGELADGLWDITGR